MKTIAKFSAFVIFLAIAFSCGPASSNPTRQAESSYSEPKVIGTIKSAEIEESSGLAASRCQSNVLWTHNDSGDDAFLYAFNLAGEKLGTWKVPNVKNEDWEDMATSKDAAGKCYLYIGEIGDNKPKRMPHTIYRLAEPIVVPANASSSRNQPVPTENVETLGFEFPQKTNDAETLMVHPRTGDIYVMSKQLSGPSAVYKIKPVFDAAETQKAQRLAEISMPAVPNGLLTGGDISPDGRRVVVCDYGRAYELVLPDAVTEFDEIWKQAPMPIELGKRKNGETIAYSVDGTSIYATSEGKGSPVIEVRRR